MQDLLNKKFGKLLVVSYARFEKSRSYWNCICDCGRKVIVKDYSLIQENTKSCGCYELENKRKLPGEASWNRMFRIYKRNAKRYNREFSLTLQEFKEICNKKCQYCSKLPRHYNPCKYDYTYSEEAKERQWIYANGIDRIDNNKGYILSNCSPCCERCNSMKEKLSFEEFKIHIKNIFETLFKE
jgi:hypothetical protein